MNEIQVVDEAGRTIGVAGKIDAHRSPGTLHRAVSVVVFDGDRVLLQRRPESAYHFAGLWANSCCTHPRPDESPVAAAERRLIEEMGVETGLREVGTFTYRAADERSGLVEAEFDHVLVGTSSGTPRPDPAQVADWAWLDIENLRRELVDHPTSYAPWTAQVIEIALAGRT